MLLIYRYLLFICCVIALSPAYAATVSLHYWRTDQQYNGWGLHLFGNAFSLTDQTNWNTPRNFDRISGDWAVADLTTNPNQFFGVIVHYGDIKSPTADLSFTTTSSNQSIWIIQDINQIFFSESTALNALAQIGQQSAQLDLSTITQQATQSALPAHWSSSANIMEIYVRAYQDSNGDGHGDLVGLTQRLDYLQQLGVTGLYLMPIFQHSGGTGYGVTDFRAIDSQYGSLQDFEDLLTQAHKRGIGIILDYPINHASTSNPLFLDASSSTDHSKRDWFIWSDTNPGWQAFDGPAWHLFSNGYYYNAFSAGLADFNFRQQAVIDFHHNNFKFWLNKGVDGFRLDAAGLLVENGADQWENQPETHTLLQQIKQLIQQYDNRLLICEAPVDPVAFADSCGHAFAFSTQNELIASAQQGQISANLQWALSSQAIDQRPLFLSNHDTFAGPRLADQINPDNPMYRTAAASYLLNAALPVTYYGEEIGMSHNGVTNTEDQLRGPMSWGQTAPYQFSSTTPYSSAALNISSHNVQQALNDNDALYSFYRALLQLRKRYPILANGSRSWQSNSGESVLRWTRSEAGNTALFAVNLSDQPQTIHWSTDANQAFSRLYPTPDSHSSSNQQGQLTRQVAAYAVEVWLSDRALKHTVPFDLDGDGRSDIVWRHAGSGDTYWYQMDGIASLQQQRIKRVDAPNWQLAAIADFDGDQQADLLWRNTATGLNYLYLMQGATIKQQGVLNQISPDWQLLGTTDLNQDQQADLIWRHQQSGQIWVYQMAGMTIQQVQYISTVSDANWQWVSGADLDGDGDQDWLWRNRNTGAMSLYVMQQGQRIATKMLNSVATDWQLYPAADFNHDGIDDLLWRNQSSGAVWLHLYHSDGSKTVSYLSTVSDTQWHVEQIGDFNGDGHSDILWRHQQTGQNYLYLIENGHMLLAGAINPISDMQWQVQP